MHDKSATKILLITHFLPPSHTAGTEQYTLGLGKTLLAKGYEVTIICAEDWDVGQNYWNGVSKESYDGLTVFRIHLNWTKAKNANKVLYDSPTVEKWLDQFLSVTDFDLVHVTSAYSLGIGILRSVKRARIPLILTLTDFWFLCPTLQLLKSNGDLCSGLTTAWQCQACLMKRSHFFQRVQRVWPPSSINTQFWAVLSTMATVTNQRGFRGLLLNMNERKRLMKEAFTLPEIVIAPSGILKGIFENNLPRPIRLSNYGHDLSWLETYQGKSKSEKIRFSYLGQIQRIKGIHLLVQAFVNAGISAQARLDIWGNHQMDPAYTQELNFIIGEQKSIALRGSYDHKRLGSILSEIDVIVVPSLWYENAPLVIHEAFAANIPVIATNIGGMAEFVSHEVNGLLFERNNSDDLATQLKRIVDEKGLLDKLSGGIPNVRTFDEEILELESMYHQLIART